MLLEPSAGRTKSFPAFDVEKYCHWAPEPSPKGGEGRGAVPHRELLYLNVDLKYIHFRSKISMALNYKLHGWSPFFLF